MLTFSDISKSFPGVRALIGVTFSARAGEVHALCGENGAGKSTLLKILSGVYLADSGAMELEGQSLHFSEPIEAIRAGVAVIYQELHLVPEMTVAENIFLGHLPTQGGFVRQGSLRESARSILAQVGVEIDPDAKVGSLSLAQRQMVEIGKALSRDARVIAFDEPTSSLSTKEVEKLFEIIGELRRQGKIIFYVSHRMDEILRICDAATILRDGQHVETFPSLQGITADTIIERMVGRSIEDIWGYTADRYVGSAGQVLEVKGILGPGLREPIDLSVAAGEIVGIFGLVGAGRTELLKAVYGATPRSGGIIQVDGAPVTVKSPQDAIRAGIVLCPEDRKKEGIVGLRSVLENTNLSARRHHAKFGSWIDERWERSNAQDKVDRLGVKTPSLHQTISFLSGGNQQKVILGRWLSERVRVLMLDEPTRGIDVGAKREIYDILYDLSRQGIGVLFVSSELPEVLGVADRILVMRQGMIAGELNREEATEVKVLELALPKADAA